MELGTYIDGRPLTYVESTGTFLVGEAPVSADQVRAYEAASQLTWARPDIAEWFHRSFPVAPVVAPLPPAQKSSAVAVVIIVGVLAVLLFMCGILTAIAIPVFNAAKTNAEKKSCWANERVIEGSALIYQADKQALPTSIEALIPEYIDEVPECPADGRYDYDPTTGKADCSVHGHF